MAATIPPEIQADINSAMQRATAAAGAGRGAPTATPGGAASIAAQIERDRQNEVVKRDMIVPHGVTRGGQDVVTAPWLVRGVLDSFKNGIGVANRIMSGEVREPTDLSPQEMLDLGSLAQIASFTSFGARGAAAAGGAKSAVGQAGERIGVDVPRGATTESVIGKSAAKITNAVPMGGAPLRKAAGTALEQLQTAAAGVKSSLGSSSMYQAGKAIEQGVEGFAGKGGVLSQRVGEAYGKVDALVQPDTTAALDNTLALANELTQRAAAAGIRPGRAVQEVLDAATRPGGLTYQAAKDLRTRVGEWVNDRPLAAAAGVSEKEASAMYAALTKDVRNVVEAAGGKEAVKAWEAANVQASAAAEVRTSLEKILKTGNEGEGALFTRLTGMAGTGAKADVDTLGLAREAVGDKNWGEVLSAMVERWGFNEAGEFDPTRFAAQWGKVTPEAKAVLFKTAGEQKQAAALDDIAKVSTVADRLRAMEVPKAGVITGALGLAGVTAAINAFTPAGFAPAAGAILGSRVVSNVLAKPEGAAAFATWAKAYEMWRAKPDTMGGALTSAARGLAAYVARDQALDPKSQLYLGNYLQGAPIGQPLAKPPTAPATPAEPQLKA